MKKILLAIVGIVILILLFVFLTQSPERKAASPTPAPTETSPSPDTSTPAPSGQGASSDPQRSDGSEPVPSASTQTDAEALLGISLPPDRAIVSVIQNDRAVIVLGTTVLSVEDSRSFFSAQMSAAGYTTARAWGVSPLDSETVQSASFRGQGENWSINLRTEGGKTSFDIQRQF